MKRLGIVVALIAAGLSLPTATAHALDTSACAPPPTAAAPLHLQVGEVACQEVTTHLLGNGIAAPFGYYVPPDCAPSLAVKCPVLYLLHGFGGDYTEMVGTPAHPSAWISAETLQPPPGFESAPWEHADPTAWLPAPALPLILVAPLGQTLPGGYGPSAGADSYWTDWNPRYAKGGDSPRYDTPPPDFESYIVDELVPFVDANFPTGSGREWRAIGGVSLGGFGSYKLGLQHPDEWSAMLSVSGAMNFLFAPGIDPSGTLSSLGIASPVALPYTRLPALTGLVPQSALPSQVSDLTTALDALGDPVADQAYFRGNTPTDLAMNAVGGVIGIDGSVNDTIPRQVSDLSDPTAEAFEDIVFPMNIDMELAFAAEHVPNTFAIHPGVHSDAYRNAWFRGLEQFAYAHLTHASPPPATFDYRTIRTDFSIWGWHVHVDRAPVEFLEMTSVGCDGLTLQGTGNVTVTVPASCRTGLAGRATFTVDLGTPFPFDDPAGLGATGLYGKTVRIPLSPLA